MTGIKSLFYRDEKADLVFNTAKNAVSRLIRKMEKEKGYAQQNIWTSLVKNSFRSPKIMGIGDDDFKFIVFYPKNADNYTFQDDSFDMKVDILSGSIYDKFHNRKYRAGDSFTVDSGDKICPITPSDEAYIKITKVYK
jgi:hypothetical protein